MAIPKYKVIYEKRKETIERVFAYKKMYEAYAKMWALLFTRKRLEYLAMSNVHSLPYLRANRILQSSDKFYEVYGISEGDGMWGASEDRARIW